MRHQESRLRQKVIGLYMSVCNNVCTKFSQVFRVIMLFAKYNQSHINKGALLKKYTIKKAFQMYSVPGLKLPREDNVLNDAPVLLFLDT